ncbi:S-adenosylmethionine:tRNA ribosyltransferase-isomerase [Pyxidicoccus sp. 3LFB2]
MKPATWPNEHPETGRLLHVQPRAGRFSDAHVSDLPSLLRAGDLLVVNDAATLPASLPGRTEAGERIELRLMSREPDDTWTAVLFGAGDWRKRTEDRPPPPVLPVGTSFVVGGLKARVVEVLPPSPRLLRVAFDARGARSGRRCTGAAGPCSTRTPEARWRCGTCRRCMARGHGPRRLPPRACPSPGACSWNCGAGA